MISRTIFEQALNRLPIGALTVDYMGEETKTYGKGKVYATLKINDMSALKDIIRRRDLGFAEAYMDHRLDVEDNQLIDFVKLYDENEPYVNNLFGKHINYHNQSNLRRNQKKQIQSHYDLGNDFYKLWLDKSMTYTCAYFNDKQDSLEQAQQQKISHVLKKLQLQKGQEFVDIGCGWGYLVVYAAKKYGAKGLGVTLSKEQYDFAKALAKKEGVEKLASFKNINYQDLLESKKQYDRVVSVGVFEHVGQSNHRQYFNVVNKLLKPGGVSVLHSITQQTETKLPAFIDKYIFPGGYIPSLRETVYLMPEYGFRVVDIENLRPHYALTLREWLKRFESHQDKIKTMYDDKFIRMWRLYLAGSISAFEVGNNNLSQIIFTKGINNDLPLTRSYLYK